MIVVSDTSALTALLTVGQEGLLPQLFTEVVIPEAVQNELLRNHALLPVWLRVAKVQNAVEVRNILKSWTMAKPRPSNWRANSAPTGCSLTNARAENLPPEKAWR